MYARSDSLLREARRAFEAANYLEVISLFPEKPDSQSVSFTPSYAERLLLTSDAHARLGNKKQAFYFYEWYQWLNDSLKRRDKTAYISELEQENKTAELQAEVLKQKLELEQARDTLFKRTIIFWCMVAVVIIALALIFYSAKSYRHLRQANERQKTLLRKQREIDHLEAMLDAAQQERRKFSERLEVEVLPKIRYLADLFSTKTGTMEEEDSRAYHNVLLDLKAVEQEIAKVFTVDEHSAVVPLKHLEENIVHFSDRLSTHYSIKVLVDGDPSRELQREVAHHLFRIVQEFVQNGIKHMQYQELTIELKATDGPIRLELISRKKGVGFRLPASGIGKDRGKGLGLKSIRERVEKMNGVLDFQFTPEVALSIVVPLKE